MLTGLLVVAVVDFGVRVRAAEPAAVDRAPSDTQIQAAMAELKRLREETHRLSEQEKWAEAIASAEKVLALEQGLFGKTHENVATTLRYLSTLHQDRGDFSAARQTLVDAAAVLEQLYGPSHYRVVDARYEIANLDQCEQLTAEQQSEINKANALTDEALHLYGDGRWREAISSVEEAVDIRGGYWVTSIWTRPPA